MNYRSAVQSPSKTRSYILFPLLLCVLVSCARASHEANLLEINQCRFTDEDTLLVKTSGSPDKKSEGREAKRKSSLYNAGRTAKHLDLEFITGYVIESGDGLIDVSFIRKEVASRFIKIVEAGTVIKNEFDKDDNCMIIFQVRKQNLKKSVRDVSTYPDSK